MLKINSVQMWKDEVRSTAYDVFVNCRSDITLTRMLESMIMKVDTDIVNKRNIASRVEAISNTLNSKTYFDNVHRLSTEEEVRKIKDLAVKLGLVHKAAVSESRKQTEKVEEAGKIPDRLPNTPVDVDSVYGVAKKEEDDDEQTV